ncbi:MAG TPA: hypothetical protein VGC37_18730 [Friedmanniella sp.]
MSPAPLVLDGSDADAPATPATRRGLVRSATRALSAGRPVTAQGPPDSAAVDPDRAITTHGADDELGVDLTASCRCHASVRWWGGGQPGRWLLSARDPRLPATTLVPVTLAAQIAAAVATGSALPPQIRVGLPCAVWWRVFSPAADVEPPRHAAVDAEDIAAAVLALVDGEHLELAGPGASSVAVLADGQGWVLEQLRPRGHVVGEVQVPDTDGLPAELARAADWVAAGGGR